MNQGYKSWNDKLLFAASPIPLKSKRIGAPAVRRSEVHTLHDLERRLQQLASTNKQRGEAALGSFFGAALGWEARAVPLGLGREAQTRELVRGYNNRRGEPTGCCCSCCTQLTAAAMLCPRCCWNLATPLARAQEEQGGASVHPTAVDIAIIAATVLSVAPRWKIWIHVQRLCPCASDALNSSSYPFRLFAQETEHKISTWVLFYTRPIFHACVPRMVEVSRYLKAIYDSIGT